MRAAGLNAAAIGDATRARGHEMLLIGFFHGPPPREPADGGLGRIRAQAQPERVAIAAGSNPPVPVDPATMRSAPSNPPARSWSATANDVRSLRVSADAIPA